MDQSLQAIFNAAQDALKMDAKQILLSGAQARQNQFAMINNKANAKHGLFSGVPAARQMQYDATTFVPNMASQVVKSIQNQAKNQEAWDKLAQSLKEINANTNEINAAAAKMGG